MQKFKVAPKSTVVMPNNSTMRKAGEIVSSDEFSPSTLDDLIQSGYLIRVKEDVDPQALAPGVDVKPIARHDKEHGKPDKPIKVRKADKPRPPKSPWVLNPDDLPEGIDELNGMILERDDTLELCETVDEAKAFLSKDYEEA